MNTELRKQAKNDFEKDFFKLMNNSFFGKAMEDIGKNRDIKLVTTDKRRNQLVSEPNYHTAKWFSECLLATEMNKIKVKINMPVYLGLSLFKTSKKIMHEFWYDYAKPKYHDVYEDIANDVEKRFDTSNYEVNIPLSTGKIKNVIEPMKDELGEKIMTEFAALRPKTYSYLMDDGDSDKGTKKCVIKRRLKFNDDKNSLLDNEIMLKSQQKFKSETHKVYTEDVNKIARSSNDDKR